MINYAREKAIKIMENSKSAIMATTGPSGLQIGELPCEAAELTIYFLIPRTSDHLFNLEQNSQVVLHTDQWELTGQGEIIPDAKKWPNISLVTPGSAMWYVLVKVIPSKIQVLRHGEWGPSETIDLSSFI